MSTNTPLQRCKERVRGLVGPKSDICGNPLPCADHPTEADARDLMAALRQSLNTQKRRRNS